MEQVASIHYWAGNGPLQPFYYIVIKRDPIKDCATLEFHSRIHTTKVGKPSFCWSCEFSNKEILRDKDLVTWIINRYGNVWK